MFAVLLAAGVVIEKVQDGSQRLPSCYYNGGCRPRDYDQPRHEPPPRNAPRAEPWYGPPPPPRRDPYRTDRPRDFNDRWPR
jgi:hypothetical protein